MELLYLDVSQSETRLLFYCKLKTAALMHLSTIINSERGHSRSSFRSSSVLKGNTRLLHQLLP